MRPTTYHESIDGKEENDYYLFSRETLKLRNAVRHKEAERERELEIMRLFYGSPKENRWKMLNT